MTVQKIFLSGTFLLLSFVFNSHFVHAATVPGVPTNLQSVPSSNQVSLSWSAPVSDGGSPLASYGISYRIGGTGSFTDVLVETSSPTSTTSTVTGLTNGSTYEFHVSAVNAIGTSTPSTSTFFTPGMISLSDSFSSTTIDSTKWLEKDTGGLGGSVGNVKQNGSVLTVNGTGNFGSNVLYSKSLFNQSLGNITIDADVTSTTCSTGGSTIFMGLGYGDINPTNSGTSAYIVYLNGSKVKLSLYQNGSPSKVMFNNFNCTNNVPFHVTLVILQNGSQLFINGALAATIGSNITLTNKPIFLQSDSAGATITYDNVSIIAASPTPNSPLLSSIAGDGQATLEWTIPTNNGGSPINNYEISSKGQTDFAFSQNVSTNSTSLTKVISGLTNGKRYKFRVAADNVSGTGAYSLITETFPVSPIPQSPSITSLSIEGFPRVGENLKGSYVFLDPNGDLEATSTYQWYSAESINGVYIPIAGATSSSYQATSTDLNQYLEFEVTPLSMNTPAQGTIATSSAVKILAGQNYLNQILLTGQSLAVGVGGEPPLTTVQPYSNKKIDMGTQNFIPLVESNVETIASANGNYLTSVSPSNAYQNVISNAGRAGYNYSQIKKGTQSYSQSISQSAYSLADAPALGKVSRVIGIDLLHGGSDDIQGNTPVYDGYLNEWLNDFNADIKPITGQTANIPMFLVQNFSYTIYTTTLHVQGNGGFATSAMPVLQNEIAKYNPDRFVMVAPDYMLVRNQSVPLHYTDIGYRKLGEYYGKVLKQVLVDRKPWQPLTPTSIKRNGNVIYAKFHVPVAPLVFDTTLVKQQTNYGFEYFDNSSSASITNVSILNDDTVKITLNTIPTGTNQRLKYAYTGTPNVIPGPDNPSGLTPGSARGNLRDSDTTISPAQYSSGEALYNWSMNFDDPIFVTQSMPLISNVIATTTIEVSSTTATSTITWSTNIGASTQVEYGTSTNYTASSTLVDSIGVGQLNHNVVLSGLPFCTTYHYRAISVDVLAQNSAASGDNTFVTGQCATVPNPPIDLIASSSDSAVDLAWTSPSADGGSTITDYLINYKPSATSTWILFNEGVSTSTVASVTGLTNGISYDFEVMALNAVGTSTPSNIASSTPMVSLTIPSSPQNLTTSAGDSNITLIWQLPTSDGNSPILDYQINYKESSSTDWLIFDDGVSTSTNVMVPNLINDIPYDFEVLAINAIGTSSPSDMATNTPNVPLPPSVPDAPANLIGTSGDATINLSWSVSSDGGAPITEYVVEYKESSSSDWIMFDGEIGTSTNVIIPNLTNDVAYDFQVSAVNEIGTSSPSELISATPHVIILSAPSAPQSLISTPEDSQVSLSWTSPQDDGGSSVIDYIVEYKESSSTEWAMFDEGISNLTNSIVNNLTNGTSYDFRISALNSIGTSSPSEITTAIPQVTITFNSPSAPTSLVASSSDSQISLSWGIPDSDGGATITDYIVEYKSTADNDWLVYRDEISINLSALVENLANGTSYDFRVSAANSVGTSTPSSVVSATPVAPITIPSSPTNLTSTAMNSQVSLAWAAPSSDGGSSITDYIIEYQANGASTWNVFSDAVSISTTGIVNSLTNGTLYNFRVSAANSVGKSIPSNTSSATPVAPATVPSAPTSLAVSTADTQAFLTWAAPSNNGGSPITDYLIEYQTISSGWSVFNDGVSTLTSATVTGLANSTQYEFRVSAVNLVGTSTSTPSVRVKTKRTTLSFNTLLYPSILSSSLVGAVYSGVFNMIKILDSLK